VHHARSSAERKKAHKTAKGATTATPAPTEAPAK
jgi:hypothetical protein